MRFLGIDPGKYGAIVCVDGKNVDILSCPKDNEIVYFLDKYKKDSFLTIEKQQSMPRDSNQSAFTVGRGYGFYEGVITTLCIESLSVSPQKWLKVFNLDSDKLKSIIKVAYMFPDVAETYFHKNRNGFYNKDIDGIAQAILIALYGKIFNNRINK